MLSSIVGRSPFAFDILLSGTTLCKPNATLSRYCDRCICLKENGPRRSVPVNCCRTNVLISQPWLVGNPLAWDASRRLLLRFYQPSTLYESVQNSLSITPWSCPPQCAAPDGPIVEPYAGAGTVPLTSGTGQLALARMPRSSAISPSSRGRDGGLIEPTG